MLECARTPTNKTKYTQKKENAQIALFLDLFVLMIAFYVLECIGTNKNKKMV